MDKRLRNGLVFLLSLYAGVAYGQDTLNFPPPAAPPKIYAVEAQQDIMLDGKLDEADWQRAPVTGNFFRIQPRQGGTTQFTTEVKVLFDKRNLYFGVFCRDSAGRKGIRVQDYTRDFTYMGNDEFRIQLDPQSLKRFCVSFGTTPLGTQSDMQVFDDQFYDADWDALWRVKTTITDSGYYAEFAIPFKSLRYEKQRSDSVGWNLTFSRIARRDYEQSVYPAIPQTYTPFRMVYGAELTGLKLPPPGINFRIQPYSLYQYEKNTGLDGKTTTGSTLKAGGEAKWAINPHAVLDATINTDFAQADVDVAVNNLTRFNLFFPEKRQFFLENQGVFAGANVQGLKPFFSRSIGLANTQFDADPIPIDAGLRYTDRTQGRSIAALYVHQRATGEQGAANFGVLRYLKNYGEQNNIGFMVTDRLDEGNAGKGFLQRNNGTVTVDGLVRPNNKITVQYLLTASKDGTNDSIGLAGNFKVQYYNNKFFWFYQAQYISAKYRPGMGFVFQNDVLYHQSVEFVSIRPKKWTWLREWEAGFDINYYQQASTLQFQQGYLYIYPAFIILKNGGIIQYALLPNWQNINFDFSVLGLPLQQRRYQYLLQELTYKTDESKHVSFKADYNFGSYYNGNINAATVGVRLAPGHKVALLADYSFNNLRKVGKYAQSINTSIYTLQLKLAWNPQWQLSAFYQYNSYNKQGQVNARLSWQFAPLSYLYIVYDEGNFNGTPLQNQALISKITWLKQF